ncbi:unnamed protein product [Eruca vesicaria subsp. sativa]|uniref:MBD domain-containing protein n=1 Tax=Eruca vesicaria subsp. sativa TaxID=29727 RepID=A0ABC8JQG8_ERUVS|nr:unnamed protein product [Eruca vesicaria subsp. sativa]
MTTRLSDDLVPLVKFPARHRREPQLYIVEPTSSRMKGRIVDTDHRSASRDFVLPRGWTVEEKQRRNSSHIDKYYTEQKTGKRFRSLVSAKRYLNNTGNVTAASVSKVQHSEQVPGLMIWNGTGFDTVVTYPKPPEKVKWVFTGPEGYMFSAHVSGSDVSSSVKRTWSETFVSLIQDCY